MIRSIKTPLLFLAVLAAAAFVSSSSAVAAPITFAGTSGPSTSLFAQSYWRGFVDFWSKAFQNQDAVILLVIALGLVGVCIMGGGGYILRIFEMFIMGQHRNR